MTLFGSRAAWWAVVCIDMANLSSRTVNNQHSSWKSSNLSGCRCALIHGAAHGPLFVMNRAERKEPDMSYQTGVGQRTAVVTGAASPRGIGFATAGRYAQEG